MSEVILHVSVTCEQFLNGEPFQLIGPGSSYEDFWYCREAPKKNYWTAWINRFEYREKTGNSMPQAMINYEDEHGAIVFVTNGLLQSSTYRLIFQTPPK